MMLRGGGSLLGNWQGGSVSHVGTSGWFPVWHGVGRPWLHICMRTIVIVYNSNSDLCQHCEILKEGNQATCALRCFFYLATVIQRICSINVSRCSLVQAARGVE